MPFLCGWLQQDSMKWFRDDDWSWNGLRQPYRVLERHPELALVERRLQVICYRSLCHPTWWPGYFDRHVNHRSPPPDVAPLDWRHDTYAFHFTDGVPADLRRPGPLMTATGMFAEIGQMILRAADMVQYFH